jgi:hypothetical protein
MRSYRRPKGTGFNPPAFQMWLSFVQDYAEFGEMMFYTMTNCKNAKARMGEDNAKFLKNLLK